MTTLEPMTLHITRVMPGWQRPGKGWNRGVVFATVDGHQVALIEGKGWNCRCGQDDCDHPDAVADLIDPATIARIEEGRPKP